MKKIYSLLVFAFAVLVTNAQTKSDPEAKKNS